MSQGKKNAIQIENFIFEEKINLLENLETFEKFSKINKIDSKTGLLAFEDINLDYGYVLYENKVDLSQLLNSLQISGITEYAMIFVNGKKIATYDRGLGNSDVSLYIPRTEQGENSLVDLKIPVENLGRINFGPELLQNRKGIIGNIKLNETILDNWTIFKISLSSLTNLLLQVKLKN